MGEEDDLSYKPRPFAGREDRLLEALKKAHPELALDAASKAIEGKAQATEREKTADTELNIRPSAVLATPREKLRLIVQAVCDEFSVTPRLLMTSARGGNVSLARQAAAYFLREIGGRTHEQIRLLIGYKNKESVGFVLHSIATLLKEDPAFKEKTEKLETAILTRYPEMKKKKETGSGN